MENQDKNLTIILLTSRNAQSGKDEVGRILEDFWYERSKRMVRLRGYNLIDGYLHEKFAAPLTTSFCNLFKYNWEVDKLKPLVRKQLIDFTTFCQSIDHDIWINKSIRSLDNHITSFAFDAYTQHTMIVFTDTRYEYEIERVEKLLSNFDIPKKLLLVEIKAGEEGPIRDRSHPEEAVRRKADIVIYNNKNSLDDLRRDVRSALGHLFE